jgi:hypothetical protein
MLLSLGQVHWFVYIYGDEDASSRTTARNILAIARDIHHRLPSKARFGGLAAKRIIAGGAAAGRLGTGGTATLPRAVSFFGGVRTGEILSADLADAEGLGRWVADRLAASAPTAQKTVGSSCFQLDIINHDKFFLPGIMLVFKWISPRFVPWAISL